MWEITHQDLRQLCDKIVARNAPATATYQIQGMQSIHIRPAEVEDRLIPGSWGAT
jgi:IS30 family transposase